MSVKDYQNVFTHCRKTPLIAESDALKAIQKGAYSTSPIMKFAYG